MTNIFSIIPPEIRYNHKISAQAKIVWSELAAYNYAKIYKVKNRTLSNDLKLSITQISRILSELKANNLILSFDIASERRLMVVGIKKTETNTTQGKKINPKAQKTLAKWYTELGI